MKLLSKLFDEEEKKKTTVGDVILSGVLGGNMESLSAVEELMSYDPVSRWVGVRQQLPQLSDLWQNTPLAQNNAGLFPLMRSLL